MNPLNFKEDSFDLDEYKKAADTAVWEKAQIKRVNRKIKIGKVLLAIAALIISIALYYVVSTVIPLF